MSVWRETREIERVHSGVAISRGQKHGRCRDETRSKFTHRRILSEMRGRSIKSHKIPRPCHKGIASIRFIPFCLSTDVLRTVRPSLSFAFRFHSSTKDRQRSLSRSFTIAIEQRNRSTMKSKSRESHYTSREPITRDKRPGYRTYRPLSFQSTLSAFNFSLVDRFFTCQPLFCINLCWYHFFFSLQLVIFNVLWLIIDVTR